MKQVLFFLSCFYFSILQAQKFPEKLNGTYCENNELIGYCITFFADSFRSDVGSMMFESHSKGIYRVKVNQLVLYHSKDTLDEKNIMRYELIKVSENEIVWKKDGSKSILKKSK
jgi:hypothetical protein